MTYWFELLGWIGQAHHALERIAPPCALLLPGLDVASADWFQERV